MCYIYVVRSQIFFLLKNFFSPAKHLALFFYSSGRLEGIEAGLNDAERFMKSEQEISLDPDVLAHQLEEQRILNAEISSSQAVLERWEHNCYVCSSYQLPTMNMKRI